MVRKNHDLSAKNKIPFDRRLIREKTWARSLGIIKKQLSGDALDIINESLSLQGQYIMPAEPVTDPSGQLHGVQRHGLDQSVGLVTLFKKDVSLHPYFRDAIKRNISTYSEELNSIIIPPGRVSPNWRGIIMFHELQHVKFHKESQFRDTLDGYWLEEQSVYVNEFKIMYQLFGEEYSKVIDNYASKAAAMMDESELTEKILKEFANYILDNVLNKSKSDFEDRIMRGAVMINIGFEGLNKIGKGSPENQALFIKSLAEHEKVLFLGK